MGTLIIVSVLVGLLAAAFGVWLLVLRVRFLRSGTAAFRAYTAQHAAQENLPPPHPPTAPTAPPERWR